MCFPFVSGLSGGVIFIALTAYLLLIFHPPPPPLPEGAKPNVTDRRHVRTNSFPLLCKEGPGEVESLMATPQYSLGEALYPSFPPLTKGRLIALTACPLLISNSPPLSGRASLRFRLSFSPPLSGGASPRPPCHGCVNSFLLLCQEGPGEVESKNNLTPAGDGREAHEIDCGSPAIVGYSSTSRGRSLPAWG